ncbi:MAG TPA: 50S ribosomal protein L11 methyltransferase [Spirochaetota bacterium]|nr:50S ribosomal protein L11 methyltransferase [Spirochaetota bacterium]HNT10821.1 50S ribosomal protein L11 methyltransferase [Spirochaetota bacterium]
MQEPFVVVLLEAEDGIHDDAPDSHYRDFRYGDSADDGGDRDVASAAWASLLADAEREANGLDGRFMPLPSVTAADAVSGAIYINPFLAFGDGRHPTTALCYRFLHRHLSSVPEPIRRGMSLIDVGTGTGILSILAAKLGVDDIDAFDLSPAAVESAVENCRMNECGRIRVRRDDLARLDPVRDYDIVLANIVSPIIIEHCAQLVRLMKPDGVMFASGVSSLADTGVRECFARNALRVIDHESAQGWNAYVLRKESGGPLSCDASSPFLP